MISLSKAMKGGDINKWCESHSVEMTKIYSHDLLSKISWNQLTTERMQDVTWFHEIFQKWEEISEFSTLWHFSTYFSERKFFIITFFGSILWIAAYSYLMVWWATVSGDVIGIPPPVSTLIACLMHSVENFEINFH